jgi:hypothetical protein
MKQLWLAGEWDGTPQSDFDFSLSRGDRELWVFRDAQNFLTHSGNLPESYIGSFHYEAAVTDSSESSITVQITATNRTNVESATRWPWSSASNAEYVPFAYDYLAYARFATSGFQDTTQVISWQQEISLR